MNIKTLHQIAQSSDLETFQTIMEQEIGKGGVMKLHGLLKSNTNIMQVAKQLKEHICAHFDISEVLLSGKEKHRRLVYIRTAMVIVLREMFPTSTKYKFGLVFGRGHTYLILCERRHKELINYSDYRDIYNEIKKL